METAVMAVMMMMMMTRIVLLATLLSSYCQADVNRLSPIGVAVAKGEIPKEVAPPVIEKKIKVVPPQEEEKTGLPPKDGMIVRVMKSMPVGRKTSEDRAQPRDKSPQQPLVEPNVPSISPVYPVRQPPSATTVYQGAPNRSTMTIGSPRPISTTNAATITSKKPNDDDDDQDDDEAVVSKSTSINTNKTTTVQSGDPWGDFVFPTRGPRPDWLRNESVVNYSFNWLYLLALFLVFII